MDSAVSFDSHVVAVVSGACGIAGVSALLGALRFIGGRYLNGQHGKERIGCARVSVLLRLIYSVHVVSKVRSDEAWN